MSAKLNNPFVGPRPFVRGEHLYGRSREIRELFYLLAAERIVWLHSPSGAGKTSLISAGLIPRLERDGFDVLPAIRVNLDVKVSTQPGKRINRCLLSTIASLEEGLAEGQRRSPEELASLSLSDYLANRPGAKKNESHPNIVLVFDQFEEIVTIDPLQVAQKSHFFKEIGDALRHEHYWALFALREEFLTQLEPYIDLIPTRWNNTFRLDLLGKQAVSEIVKKTAQHGGREFADDAAQMLFTDLAKTKVQQPDGSFVEQAGHHVEPVQLQVVCRRLWDDMPAHNLRIGSEDLRQFGDVSEALGAYYHDAVTRIAQGNLARQRQIRQWFSKRLITAAGIRGQVLRGEGSSEGLANEIIEQLLNTHLIRGEKRAGATWYELAHDRLVQPIQDDNAVWLKENLQPFQRLAMVWAEQGRPPDGGDYLLKSRDLWAALQWKKNNPGMIDKDEGALLKISQKDWMQHYAFRATIFVFILGLGYLWNEARLAEQEALASAEQARLAEQDALDQKKAVQEQNSVLQHQVTLLGNAGLSERDSEVGSPLKAAHYLALAVEGFTRVNNIGASRNFLLATQSIPSSLLLRRIIDLEASVLGMELSQDGNRMLTWSRDNMVRVWDSQTGKPLTPPLQHEYWVNGAIFSMDEKRILTWSYDGTARVWDSHTGMPLTAPLQHENEVNGALFSQDDRRILTWSKDKTARVWDSHTGKPLTASLQHEKSVNGAVFSADDNRILTWSDGTARVWDSHTGMLLTAPLQHENEVNGALFSQDDRRILTWSKDKTARVWDSQTGEALTPPLQHENEVNGALFSQYDRRILTWSRDGTAREWDSQTGEPLMQPLQHKGPVSGAEFSEDEKQLLTWSRDGYAQIWDSQTGKKLRKFRHEEVYDAVFSEDKQQLLTWSDDGTLRVWNSNTGALMSPFKHNGKIVRAMFSKNGRFILALSSEGIVRIWDDNSDAISVDLLFQKEAIDEAVFNIDESRILTWSLDGPVQVWNSQTGKKMVRLKQVNSVNRAMFIADERRILTLGQGTVQVWDSQTGKELIKLELKLEHNGLINNVVLSADGKYILTRGIGNTAYMWDSHSGEKIKSIMIKHRSFFNAGMVFSADNQRILSWGTDGITVIDVNTDEELEIKLPQPLETYDVSWGGLELNATFSADSKHILINREDGMVGVWNSKTGKITGRLDHKDNVRGAMFTGGQNILTWGQNGARVWNIDTEPLTPWLKHDGGIINGVNLNVHETRILTWTSDTVRVWDSHTGEPLTSLLKHDKQVLGAKFSVDENRVLAWSEDGTLRIWDSNTGKILRRLMLQHKQSIKNAILSTDEKRILILSEDGIARLWNIAMVTGWPSNKIVLKTEVETGTELKPTGELKTLSAEAWQEKKWCQYDRIQYDLKRISEQQWRTSERLCNELQQNGKTTRH